MNWAEIQGNWEEMGPLLQTQWPKLSHDDLARLGGSREELVKTLTRRYDLRRGDAEEAVCQFEREVRFPGAMK